MITSAPQTFYTQACSAAVTFESRTDAGVAAPVAALTAVSPIAAPAALSFFSDSSCATAATLVSIAAGASTGNVWLRAAAAGNATLTVGALGLLPASQLVKVVALPTSLSFTATAPTPVVASNCFPATLTTRIGASNAPVIADTPVALTELPVDGTRYYTDAACTTKVSSVTLLAGQSTASFFIKAISGGTVTVTATSVFGSAQQAFAITGAVRRGTCSFVGSNGTVDCFISPVQTNTAHTMMVFQASSNSEDPDYNQVTCELVNTARLRCRRAAVGGAVQVGATVSWQTLELPVGLRVETPSAGCSVPVSTLSILTAVNPASSFVLKSGSRSGTNFGGDDLGVAYLQSATTAIYENVACSNSQFSVQVVELSGIAVTRDSTDAGIPTGSTAGSAVGLPVASANRIVFAQPSSAILTAPICDRLVRADAPSPTTLSFSRAAGTAGGGCTAVELQVAWERVDFGPRALVQPFTTTLPTGTLTSDVTVAAVDLTRTLVFSSAQTESGQGAGESAENVSIQNIGEALGRFDLIGPTTVHITREHATAAATFTFYVVQIEP